MPLSISKGCLAKYLFSNKASNKIVELHFQHVYWPEMTEFYIRTLNPKSEKNLLTTTKNILKSDQPYLKWAAIQSNHWE